ncbi:hypothetical protein OROMI_024382 [Orobanche minor]
MATFILTSNNYFLTPIPNSRLIGVVECPDDLTSFGTIHSDWTLRARIGKFEQYNTLEVFGTKIHGDKLNELASELILRSNSMIVNREGLCFLSVGSRFVKRVRLNDYFGWSKFGVKPEIETVWNKFNMFDRRIVIDLEEMKKSLSESKDKETELSETLMSKSKALDMCNYQLTENQTELSGLNKILDEMKRSLSESKDKEIELSETILNKSKALDICNYQLTKNQTELSELKKVLGEMKKSLSESKDKEIELSETILSKSKALDICNYQLTDNQSEISGLNKILDEMKKSLLESKNKETELSETLLSKSKALDICNYQLMKNQTELSGLNRILNEMKKSLSESKNRETKLSETLLSKSKELDNCKSQSMEYRTELFELRKILEKMETEKVELEKKWIEEAKSGKEWKKVAEEREEELRKVESQLVAKTKHADTLKDAAGSLMNSMWDLNKLGRREMAVFWNLAVLKVGAIPSSLRTWWINNQVK